MIQPNGGIVVQRHLTAMLSLAHGKQAPGDQFTSAIKLVAGACNPLNLEFSWAAA